MSSPPSLEQRMHALVDELEGLCAEAEVALRERRWPALGGFLHDQRRVRQEIINAVADGGKTIDELPEVAGRLQAILAFRGDQLRRLMAYREDVSLQLQNARKWKNVLRSARVGLGPLPVLISRDQ